MHASAVIEARRKNDLALIYWLERRGSEAAEERVDRIFSAARLRAGY